MNDSRTTIWKNANGELVQISELAGFPYGKPNFGERINTDYGEATCFGYSKVGSDNEIVEIKLTLN